MLEQYLEFINLYIKIMLLSIIIRGIFFLLPERMYYYFRIIGMIFRYPVKRVFYFLYGVKVYDVDWEIVEMRIENVKDFDCLLTTNIIVPFLSLSALSGFLLTYGNLLFSQKYYWFGGLLYFIGILMVSFSIPDTIEVKKVFDSNFQTSIKFVLKLIAFISALLLIENYFPDVEFWISATICILILVIPLYHFNGNKIKKEEKRPVITTDPFF